MKESVKDKLVKCNSCGKYYIDGIEGDSNVCDACFESASDEKIYLDGDCYGDPE